MARISLGRINKIESQSTTYRDIVAIYTDVAVINSPKYIDTIEELNLYYKWSSNYNDMLLLLNSGASLYVLNTGTLMKPSTLIYSYNKVFKYCNIALEDNTLEDYLKLLPSKVYSEVTKFSIYDTDTYGLTYVVNSLPKEGEFVLGYKQLASDYFSPIAIVFSDDPNLVLPELFNHYEQIIKPLSGITNTTQVAQLISDIYSSEFSKSVVLDNVVNLYYSNMLSYLENKESPFVDTIINKEYTQNCYLNMMKNEIVLGLTSSIPTYQDDYHITLTYSNGACTIDGEVIDYITEDNLNIVAKYYYLSYYNKIEKSFTTNAYLENYVVDKIIDKKSTNNWIDEYDLKYCSLVTNLDNNSSLLNSLVSETTKIKSLVLNQVNEYSGSTDNLIETSGSVLNYPTNIYLLSDFIRNKKFSEIWDKESKYVKGTIYYSLTDSRLTINKSSKLLKLLTYSCVYSLLYNYVNISNSSDLTSINNIISYILSNYPRITKLELVDYNIRGNIIYINITSTYDNEIEDIIINFNIYNE